MTTLKVAKTHDKTIPFEYRMYNNEWQKVTDTTASITLPRVDVYRYVFWEKEYVTKWFISQYKSELQDTIRIARYRAYPFGPGRAKAGAGESLAWVKKNMPYIVLLHTYTSFQIAANVFLKFEEEFIDAINLMEERHEKQVVIFHREASKKDSKNLHYPR